MPQDTQEADVEVMPTDNAALRRIPAVISNSGAWFAWGFIAGFITSMAAVYVIRKRM